MRPLHRVGTGGLLPVLLAELVVLLRLWVVHCIVSVMMLQSSVSSAACFVFFGKLSWLSCSRLEELFENITLTCSESDQETSMQVLFSF